MVRSERFEDLVHVLQVITCIVDETSDQTPRAMTDAANGLITMRIADLSALVTVWGGRLATEIAAGNDPPALPAGWPAMRDDGAELRVAAHTLQELDTHFRNLIAQHEALTYAIECIGRVLAAVVPQTRPGWLTRRERENLANARETLRHDREQARLVARTENLGKGARASPRHNPGEDGAAADTSPGAEHGCEGA